MKKHNSFIEYITKPSQLRMAFFILNFLVMEERIKFDRDWKSLRNMLLTFAISCGVVICVGYYISEQAAYLTSLISIILLILILPLFSKNELILKDDELVIFSLSSKPKNITWDTIEKIRIKEDRKKSKNELKRFYLVVYTYQKYIKEIEVGKHQGLEDVKELKLLLEKHIKKASHS